MLDSANHLLYSNRSYANFLADKFVDAKADGETCVLLAPNFQKGYLRLGNALHSLKNYSEALKIFDKGLKLEANNVVLEEARQKTIKAQQQQQQQREAELHVAATMSTISRVCGNKACPLHVLSIIPVAAPTATSAASPAASSSAAIPPPAALLICNRCRNVFYCSASCQKLSWPLHKHLCFEKDLGYPSEPVLRLFEVRSLLPPIDSDAFKALSSSMHILFASQRHNDPRPSQVGASLTVVKNKESFLEQFNALSCNLFSSWNEAMWANVLIAGGSILSSLLVSIL